MRITLDLIGGCERMNVREIRPGHRDHLGGGVQLHRARPQRDHRAIQRQIPVGEAAHIAHHLGLGPVHMKNRMG